MDSFSGDMKVRCGKAIQSVLFVHKAWDRSGELGRGDCGRSRYSVGHGVEGVVMGE